MLVFRSYLYPPVRYASSSLIQYAQIYYKSPWNLFAGVGPLAVSLFSSPLQWRHNGRDSFSNHQPHECLLDRLIRCRSKKTSKLRVTGLCARNSPETNEFPAQRASNAETVSIWWRHHYLVGMSCIYFIMRLKLRPFSELYLMQYKGLCVFSIPTFILAIVGIFCTLFYSIKKSEISTISQSWGSGYGKNGMSFTSCMKRFLWQLIIEISCILKSSTSWHYMFSVSFTGITIVIFGYTRTILIMIGSSNIFFDLSIIELLGTNFI